MRVLMFGWEFPPHITGGLGTACHGLSTSLSHLVERLTFVLPRVRGRTAAGDVEVLGIGELPVPANGAGSAGSRRVETAPTDAYDDEYALAEEVPEGVELLAIPSSLRPYVTEEQYLRWIARLTGHTVGPTSDLAAFEALGVPMPEHQGPSRPEAATFQLSGDYGANLFDEVARYATAAGRAARHDHYDVVHAHDWMTYLAGIEAKRVSKVPLVAHVHALEFDRSGDNINERIYQVERLGMSKADRIITVSQRTKETAVERYGMPPDKIRVVHNGAVHAVRKRRRAAHPLGGPMVVFLGRVTMQKGPEYFLEAARLVADRLPGARFVMAGNGDLLPRMVERMAELDLLDRFHFTGFVDARRRDTLLRQADLLVMPSVSEPFGIVPLEAIAHGVPVVISKQSGVAEVLRHAFKIDFWDVRRAADVIIQILTNEPLRRQLREGGTEDLDGISWDKAATKVRDVYRELM